MVKQGTVRLLAELLSHENTDIALDVVQLLVEVTEEDVEAGEEGEENQGALGGLVGALMELNIFELLVANLSRLDEKEEADRQGVFQTLGVFPHCRVFTKTRR